MFSHGFESVACGVQSSSSSIKIMAPQPGILAFCDPLQREVAYELWPERCRVTVHRKCAAFLERIFGTGLTKKRSEYGPLLGWDDEIVTFHSHLKAYQDFGERHILVFESLTGSGKSHLLTELAYIAQDAGQRVVAVELLEINFPISNEIGKMNENERLEEQFATWEKVLEKTLRQGETAKEKWESLITSAVEALLLTEISSSTAEDDGRVCIIRPDISLDNMVLPTTLKGVWSSSLSIKIMVLQPGVLAFCDPLQREVAYELWPERQRVIVYRKCAAFLEHAAGQPSKTNRKHNGICSYECEAIVESVLVPLPHHYLAMGDSSRAFYYLLECVAAYLHVSNNYMALMKLNEVEFLRKSLKDRKVIACFNEATFFSFKGKVKRWGGVEGSPGERSWMHFPVSGDILGIFSHQQIPAVSKKKLAWLLQQNFCLSLLDHLYSLENTSSGWTFSHLATFMKANTQSTAVFYRAEDSHN
ncbi:hypothetical protein Q9233_017278 [Columba guinea]|nr:hypothetical protein Q9233_017278 [Columba guinea]